MPYSKSRRICLIALSVDACLDLAALLILILTFILKWDMPLFVTIALALNCAEILTLLVGLFLVRWLAVNWASISLLAVYLLLTLVLDFLPIFALSSFLHAPWDLGLSLHLGLSSDSLFAISLGLSLAETFALVIALVFIIIAIRGEARDDSTDQSEEEEEEEVPESGPPPAGGSDGTSSENQSGTAGNNVDERTPLLPPPSLPSSLPPPPSSPPPPPPSSSSPFSPGGNVTEELRRDLEEAMKRIRSKGVGTREEAIPAADSDQQTPPPSQADEILEQTAK
jgi:hypothetical protein